MNTFNPTYNTDYDKMVETRPRSYSQDNIVNDDQSEIIGVAISCKEAMSQYVCH